MLRRGGRKQEVRHAAVWVLDAGDKGREDGVGAARVVMDRQEQCGDYFRHQVPLLPVAHITGCSSDKKQTLWREGLWVSGLTNFFCLLDKQNQLVELRHRARRTQNALGEVLGQRTPL